jgi:uncharacterized protein (UPF0261 family)
MQGQDLSVSGTLWVVCAGIACRKVIEQSKKMQGVTMAYRVQKESQNEPDVIVNITGVNEQQITQVENSLKKIHGVSSVTHQSGSSLLY